MMNRAALPNEAPGPSAAPRAAGAQVTVFDPDLDPDGSHACLLTDILVTGLGSLSRDRQ
jgi:arginase